MGSMIGLEAAEDEEVYLAVPDDRYLTSDDCSIQTKHNDRKVQEDWNPVFVLLCLSTAISLLMCPTL